MIQINKKGFGLFETIISLVMFGLLATLAVSIIQIPAEKPAAVANTDAEEYVRQWLALVSASERFRGDYEYYLNKDLLVANSVSPLDKIHPDTFDKWRKNWRSVDEIRLNSLPPDAEPPYPRVTYRSDAGCDGEPVYTHGSLRRCWVRFSSDSGQTLEVPYYRIDVLENEKGGAHNGGGGGGEPL